ncbi:MAG: response regulator [Dongiaceae bacterium]
MSEAAHILVVDDDRRLRDLLKRYLSQQEFRVSIAEDVAEARAMLSSMDFDLLVLDIMMPGESGLELAQSLRKTSDVPILLLTAKGEVGDRIEGLETGADDYLVKPFEPKELTLRIRAILKRRPALAPATPPTQVHFGSFHFDLSKGVLRQDAIPLPLTSAESALLAALAETPGQAWRREDLVRRLGGDNSERSIDVQVTRLRRKIEQDPSCPIFLQTVRGKGYVLFVDEITSDKGAA